jgi:hypothetical protein
MQSKKKDKPLKIGTPPSQMKGKKWYERPGNVLDPEELLRILPKSKVVSYLKVSGKSFGGALQEIQYWKVLDNGYMIFVDLGRCRIGIVRGMPTNRFISAGTRRDFEKAIKTIQKLFFI